MICYIEKNKYVTWPGWWGRITHDISTPYYTGPAAEEYYEESLIDAIERGRGSGAQGFVLVERNGWGEEVHCELTSELLTYYLLREPK